MSTETKVVHPHSADFIVLHLRTESNGDTQFLFAALVGEELKNRLLGLTGFGAVDGEGGGGHGGRWIPTPSFRLRGTRVEDLEYCRQTPSNHYRATGKPLHPTSCYPILNEPV